MIEELILAAQNPILNDICLKFMFFVSGFYFHRAWEHRKKEKERKQNDE